MRFLFLVSGRGRQRGQIMVVGAAVVVALIAICGLSIDAGHDYLVRRSQQNASDMAALGAGKQLALLGGALTSAAKSNDPSVRVAHDMAANNGFSTTYNNACDVSTGGTFTTTWYDVGGLSCSATGGFTTKITINSPPAVVTNALPLPPQCTGSTKYNCFQIVMTYVVRHFFMTAFGQPTATITTVATVFAQPGATSYGTPPPLAVYLYQPQAGCDPGKTQCFNEGNPASKSNLSCTAGGTNCPTFWAQHGSVQIRGIDGNLLSPAADYPALESNGDMVLQDNTTICDPYNGAVCQSNQAVGAKGFALTGKLYCQKFQAGSPGTLAPCTTTGQAPLGWIASNETTFSSATWTPTVSTSGLAVCGGLVLNGSALGPSSFTGTPDPSCYDTTDPYTLQPGIYSYIVINHGRYAFESGLYDIQGTAPVNSLTAGGYLANGIDHSRENNNDWDLCTGGQPNSCGGLTAGVWIGHGSGGFGAAVGSTKGQCIGGVSTGNQGGGGDNTDISGTGVTFRFEPGSAGFVSTNEVSSISFSSPGLGGLAADNGAPILFDLENNGWIHLDSQSGSKLNGFSGIIYQKSTAIGGGVEINPGLANKQNAAVTGQVFAYSMATFGQTGTAVDFSKGYGGGATPTIGTSGKNEASILNSASYGPAVDRSGNPIAGFVTFTLQYTDEWALDAYDTYVMVNSGSPTFFSQGVWPSGYTGPQPPNGSGYTPSDSNPSRPGVPPPGYTAYADPLTGLNTDWVYTIPGGAGATIETSGYWTWGHESDIGSSNSGNNIAYVKYTFAQPSGSSVAVGIFMTDGDHCGDYATATYSFSNPGFPSGGIQTGGTIRLVQ